eukprot:CAMPEP_0181045176 /NCGR_PEP_ID=MMETSP1070-20121207/13666_1 /TAXON_ID=265543 /ORGANISM="Minutocellus polymorphus, Strain NH13" /LENGTH=89 /DNA_ID=CAMNT_0023123683 /DNA_START=46 /DNA_END=313 /DNA_ORIENTATION=+
MTIAVRMRHGDGHEWSFQFVPECGQCGRQGGRVTTGERVSEDIARNSRCCGRNSAPAQNWHRQSATSVKLSWCTIPPATARVTSGGVPK